MLATKRALCSGCQHDLLTLFYRGFCGPAVPKLRSPLRPSSRRNQWQQQHRAFRSTADLQQNGEPQAPVSGTEAPSETFLSDDELNAQFAELKHLEQFADPDEGDPTRRRRPKGIAVQDVKVTDEDIVVEQDQTLAESPSLRGHEHSLAELHALREEGASATEIAGRARELFGDRLPLQALQASEFSIYKRLFDDPLLPEAISESVTLLDESGEEVDYDSLKDHLGFTEEENEASLDFHDFEDKARSREQLEQEPDHLFEDEDVFEEAEYADEEAAEEDEESDPTQRRHPLTALGKFATTPKTLSMPIANYVKPLSNLMLGHSYKQLTNKRETESQVAVQMEASQNFMGEMAANAFLTAVMPPAYAAISAALVDARRRLGPTWLTSLLSKEGGPRVLDAGAGGAAILAWNEITEAHWNTLHTSETEPNPVPASKAVVLAGSDPLRHRGTALLDNTTFIPRLPDFGTTRSKPTLDDDRPAQSRKSFDVIFSSYSLLPFKEEWERKQYISNLWSLLSPEGGVLIFIEKGMPRGFEAIASAREHLLERFIAIPPGQETKYSAVQNQDIQEGAPWTPEPGMIIGPCSNHEGCPMYKIQGVSIGRKDICSFQQRYIRPPPLQRVLGAKTRNHDDVDFSYLSVMRGRDLRRSDFSAFDHIADASSAPLQPSNSEAFAHSTQSNTEAFLDHIGAGLSNHTPDASIEPDSADDSVNINLPTQNARFTPTHHLPRLVFPPLKRRSHVILDLCTPRGTIERWTVPRSFGKQAYRDARKAQWGDLWGLGAKTRIPRTVRQGSGSDKLSNILGKGKSSAREEKLANARSKLREREELDRAAEEEADFMDRELDRLDVAGRNNRSYASNPHDEPDPEDEEDDDASSLREAFARARLGTSALYPPVPDHIKRTLNQPSPDDPLEAEIEAKLRAWEDELSDNRPIDRTGKPLRTTARRERNLQKAREAMDEQEREKFWGAVDKDVKERQGAPIPKEGSGDGSAAKGVWVGAKGAKKGERKPRAWIAPADGNADLKARAKNKVVAKPPRGVQQDGKRRPKSSKPVRSTV
ncbi:37S ribosomal protein S22, mitochondrial [Cyphellophora attinorum]|uniref:37S ribosomal protein S22, mitochondrial n=1 Tax=Cyphellophora attinorum TaxID=1664694 RepID=A0A0N1H7I4_9EURO|nr:37S ribosomal protein S22, mitochondrial [Phialophora attinorum]KPI42477.1 37S ribosomal protein S22, mitochondrial [Phialophora attinorum]